MAPAAKTMKRPAAVQGGAQKKAKQEDPVTAKCEAVAAAVMGAEGFPSDTLRMLASSAKLSLTRPKGQRHPFQEGVIKMLEEVLAAAEVGAKAKVAGLESKVQEADTEKAAREALAEAAAEDVKAKAGARDAAKAAFAEATGALASAKASTSEAEREQKEGDEAYARAAGNKASLEAMLIGDYAALKEAPAAKALRGLVKLCGEFGFENQLVTFVESTLSKPVGDRGTFDKLVLELLDEQFASSINTFGEQVRSGEPAKAERAAKVDAAEAVQEEAAQKEAACKAEAAGAEAALKQAETDKKTADKAVKDFASEMKQANVDLRAAKCDLEECQGVVATLKELVEREDLAKEALVEAPPADAPAEGDPAAAAAAPATAAEVEA